MQNITQKSIKFPSSIFKNPQNLLTGPQTLENVLQEKKNANCTNYQYPGFKFKKIIRLLQYVTQLLEER